MNKSDKKLFKSINSYISSIVEDWDSEKFKKVFEENIPRLTKKEIVVKKPKSAYMYFSTDQEIRETIKRDNPEATTMEISVKIGELWKSEKYRTYSINGFNIDYKTGEKYDYKNENVSKWFDLANDDKRRYEEEMKNNGLEIKKVETKSTRPKSAYDFFCKENRPKIKNNLKDSYSGSELTKNVTLELNKKWESYKDRNPLNTLTQKDKKGKFMYTKRADKWIEMANKDKERFEKREEDEQINN
jgi:hypothetical protein